MKVHKKETKLLKWWLHTYHNFLVSKEHAGQLQIRKFFQNQHVQIDGEIFRTGIPLTFQEMGYRNNKNKMTQLVRNYLNVEALESANEKFVKRLRHGKAQGKQSAITANMTAHKKDSRSMGFCMQTITINYFDDKLNIDLYYRSTEWGQKFLADLRFLNEKVFPILLKDVDVPVNQVNFYFSTMYISSRYLPILFSLWDPVKVLPELKKKDPKFFRTTMSWMKRLMDKECRYTYGTAVAMHHVYHTYAKPRWGTKELRRFIRDNV